MLRIYFIFALLIIAHSNIYSEEIYSLKENYEVRESIEGTDQISIQKGMKKALSKLAINLSGDSNITNSNKIRSLLSSPERYVNQYKLINDEVEGLQAEFIFDGNLLRTYLSESEIPIWLSDKPLILTYIPCIEKKSITNELEYLGTCNKLKKELKRLSMDRNARLAYPLMDLTDIGYSETLSSISPSRFMNKLSRRYAIDEWLICIVENEFGILLEDPVCSSSRQKDFSSLRDSLNLLINEVNQDKSLIVDKSKQNNSVVYFEQVKGFQGLESMLKELADQVLVFDLSLKGIEGDLVKVKLSHYGDRKDLESLLKIHSSFKEINTNTRDIISFSYIEK